MKKIFLLMILSGCVFANNMLLDSVKISSQANVTYYMSDMVFPVQVDSSSTYIWKKMRLDTLRHIFEDSLKISNLSIPRMTGTPTTHFSLRTFSDNTLYRNDFNYNFRKLDSLSTIFYYADFLLSGDTLKLRYRIPSQTSQGGKYLKTDGTNMYWTTGGGSGFDTSGFYNMTGTIKFSSTGSLYLPTASGTNQSIWYDLSYYKLHYQNPSGAQNLASEAWTKTYIDTTKISYLAKANTWVNTNTFQNTTQVTTQLYLGSPNSHYGLLSFYSNSNSSTTTLKPTQFPTGKTLILPDVADTLANYAWVRSHSGGGSIDTTKIPYLAKNNTWTAINYLKYAFIINPASGYYTQLQGTATASRVLTMPDETDTIATRGYTRSHGGSVSLSGNNTWTGTNTFNNQVTINSYGGGLTCIPALALGFPSTTYGNINLYNSSNNYYTSLYPVASTANRTIYFPDASGTIALISQVPSLVSTNHWTNNNMFDNNHIYLLNPTTGYYSGIVGSATTTRVAILPDADCTLFGSTGANNYSTSQISSITSYTVNATTTSSITCALSGAGTITYITGNGLNGQVVYIVNFGSSPITITESTSTNSVHNGGDGNFNINRYGAAQFIYDANSGGWYHVK